MKNQILNEIKNIREDNNRLWMGIIEIALDKAPIETKRLLEKITQNDILITKAVKELTDG